ncbi:MAG: beta-ketoacyl-ACP synthase II [Acidobacteriota bacterium]|nr:beta-ketoacyl-ACP synthase II [Acidobacteriota bacterium]MDQ7086751.1 beta-ketoacyl-ACP synthase II [Acidobacteriota bacterium]
MSVSSRRVFVTGLSLVSPLGLDAESSWRALLEGRSGIAPITHFDASAFASRIAGEVKGFDVEQWMEAREAKRMARFAHFALACAQMALDDAGIDLEKVDRRRFGVIIGSGIGGIPLVEQQHGVLLERGPRRLSPFLIPGMIINMASGVVSMRFGLKGPNSATVTACATGNHALGDALRMIQHGDADWILAGGTEAAVSPLSVGGFCAMKALSTRNDEPERASRPFDGDRDGFVMAEGCGLLLLESEESARRRDAKVYAEVAGFGATGDAFHMSAPPEDGDGMVRVMRAALADAGMSPADIDYVNAHGTSTPTGDVIEARAVRRVFGGHADRLVISSTKSATGHLLGAAGGLESVVSCLAIDRGICPPTINLDNLDPRISSEEGEDPIALKPERFAPGRPVEREVGAALSNSFGFGGTNATLVFRKIA